MAHMGTDLYVYNCRDCGPGDGGNTVTVLESAEMQRSVLHCVVRENAFICNMVSFQNARDAGNQAGDAMFSKS